MLNSIIEIFDPSVSLSQIWNLCYSLLILLFLNKKSWNINNYTKIIIQNYFELAILGQLSKRVIKSKFTACMLCSPFIYVLVINISRLLPYGFTLTILPALTFSISIIIFFSMLINIVIFNYNNFMVHLVPKSSPNALIPVLVLIELISIIIRPITLSLRLIANLIAGHLIISIISRGLIPVSLLKMPLAFSLLFIRVIESAVSMIQAFVLTLLLFLYIKDSV